MRLNLLLVGVLVLLGCQQSNRILPLTLDSKQNDSLVKNYVPIGTTLSGAEKLMHRAAFRCELKRKERLYTEKTGGVSSEGPKLDFLMCSRGEKIGRIGKREEIIHQAFLLIDPQDKSKDVITTVERPEQW